MVVENAGVWKKNKQKILLLHGAGCTYKMWTPQIEVL